MKEYTYKVVGVTFPARDGSDRQESIKELFNEEVETESYLRSHNIKFEGYDYKGDDALAVFVDGKEIGNIAADKVKEVAEIAQRANNCKVIFSINGHDVDDYEYIVDRHLHKKDWKETDPYFDAEEADEEYNALMEELKENTIYSAKLKFTIKEDTDDAKEVTKEETPKKEYSKGTLTLLLILGILLILMSLVLTLAKPIVGIIGIIIGVLIIVYSRKNKKNIKDNKQ